MSGTPVKRTDWAGVPRAKAGAPRVELPTQDLDDLFIVEMVPYRAEHFELPVYGSAHPRSAEHKLRRQQLVTTNDNQVFVQQIYMKDSGAPLVGEQVDASTQGEKAVIESRRVPSGTAADQGFLVVSSSVEPQDAQISQKRTVTVPEWPILKGTYVDEASGIAVEIEKTFVPNGTAGGIIGGKYVEVQPHDKYKSISIASKVDLNSLPSPKTTYRTIQKHYPAVLRDQYVIIQANAAGTYADGKLAFYYDIQGAFSASTKARWVETWHNGPPPLVSGEVETSFNPQGAQVVMYAMMNNGTLRVSNSQIPVTLHGQLVLRSLTYFGGSSSGVQNGFPAGLSAYVKVHPFDQGPIPATSPSVLTPGTEFIHKINVEEWRFGVFKKTVIHGTIPNPP